MGVLISDFFFLLYHYSVLRIFQSSLLSKMKMRCVDFRLSKNYIFQNVRHPVKIFPRTSRERERETEKMKKEERKEIRSRFANTDNRQRSDCATPATVNHEGLQSLSSLSLSLSYGREAIRGCGRFQRWPVCDGQRARVLRAR